jgi:hypothetical protein
MLDGDEDGPGWRDALAKAERRLSVANQRLRAFPKDGDKTSKGVLARESDREAISVGRLKADIGVLERLMSDERMEDSYTLLGGEFTDDAQWRGFAAAAWAANMDYTRVREKLKQARQHRDQIAKTAHELAELLDDTLVPGISWPLEFGDVATLLKNTDNHELEDHNLAMWRVVRKYILGEPPSISDADGRPPKPITAVSRNIIRAGDKVDRNPAEVLRASINYAWGVAPRLSALLRTLSVAASQFEPREFGFPDAAVRTRQHNAKTEYIRAFGHVLSERKITVSRGVMKAMAIAATVAMNHPDVDVTYDDVRKALSE